MSTSADPYDLRTLPAVVDADGHADAATRAWMQADAQGFHGARMSEAAMDRWAASMVADGHRLTAVHRNGPLPAELGQEAVTAPVATFSSFERTIDVGGAEPLAAHLISSVTVRPTHRRRGLLRRMMTADLERAAAQGYPLAALTVSEATIYRRFGFGVATSTHSVEVATGARFELLTPPPGRCEVVDARTLLEVGPAVFARFHATHPGSVDRQSAHWAGVAGLDDGKGEPDPAVRAAVHLDEHGAVDGFVSYRFAGWETKPATIDVIDLVAADAGAYLGLWEFLGAVDLVDRVRWHAAPVEDPLRWALSDARLVSTTRVQDWLWLRVLDPVRAFAARGYVGEGELVLEVEDALGFAAGRFRLRVAGGRGEVERVEADPDLALDVSALGSLHLGGVDPLALAAAGRVRELVPGAALRARTLLAPTAPVWGITHF